jgi:hypothetical protein
LVATTADNLLKRTNTPPTRLDFRRSTSIGYALATLADGAIAWLDPGLPQWGRGVPDTLERQKMKTKSRPKIDPPKPGSKIDRLVSVLTNEGGTVLALSTDFNWLPHTTRAALTRLKQRGYQVERTLIEGGKESIYRIETKPTRKSGSP